MTIKTDCFELVISQALSRMLKQLPLKLSGPHISVFKDRSERGAFNMLKKYVRKSSKIQKMVENAATPKSTPCLSSDIDFLGSKLPSVGSNFRTKKAYVQGLAGGAFSIRQKCSL